MKSNMKILHIGKSGNMERFTASNPFTNEFEKISLPMGETTETYLRFGGDADFIIADAVAIISGELIRGMPALKMIHSEGVAYNQIDREAAQEQGVFVCNCPGMNATAVAEQTLLLMVSLLKDVVNNDRAVREGRQITVKEGYMSRADLRQLSDCKVGLVGFGAIGCATARLLQAYGAETYYYKRNPLDKMKEKEFDAHYLPLTTLLATCDIISLHLPVNHQTRGMCDDSFFAGMKQGALFINTSRGELVDSAALVRALKNGTVAMAGLDTLDHEPVQTDHIFLNSDVDKKIVFSPHIGGITASAFRTGYEMIWSDIARMVHGEAPEHQV